MPGTTTTSLTDDEIDDLIYFARAGQLEDFRACIEAFARTSNISHYEVVRAAVEEQSGNSPLHMASANGHASKLGCLASDYFYPLALKLKYTL